MNVGPTWFCSVSVGLVAHSCSKVFVRSRCDVGWEVLTQNLHPFHLSGVEWGWGQGLVKFFHTKLIQPCFMDHALCLFQSCWNKKGPSPNFSHNVGSIALSKMSWYAEALSLTGSKRQSSPTPEKQPHTIIPPPTNFSQSTQCSLAGNDLPVYAEPRFAHQALKQRSVTHHSTEQVSTAPESCEAVLYSTLFGELLPFLNDSTFQ